MTTERSSPHEAAPDVGTALKHALAARDRSLRPSPFSSSLPQARRTHQRWHPVATSLGAIAAGAIAITVFFGREEQVSPSEGFDAATAHQLSSPEYWRVPSDELLALSASPPDLSLPLNSAFEMSLEESVP